jgi:hypothetical protein
MAGLIGNVCYDCEQERKYFDSGDYAMQKAGVASPDSVGSPGGLGQGLKGMEGLERATPERSVVVFGIVFRGDLLTNWYL